MVEGIIIKKELVIVFGIILWAIYFIVQCITIKNKDKKFFVRQSIQLAFVVYIGLLVGVTLFPIRLPSLSVDVEPVINLNILSIFDYGLDKHAVTNIVGNIILLAPLTILLPLIGFSKLAKVKNIILFSFLVSLLIECIQYIEAYFKIVYVPRAFDILDLILNTFGGLIGFFIYKAYKKSIENR